MSRALGRRSATSCAARRCCPRARSPSARGGHGGAQGREPAAHRLVQAARRAGQARRARRRRAPPAWSPASAGNHAPGAGLRRARRAACRARSSCPPTRRSPRSRRRAALGARCTSAATRVDECLVAARERADEAGLAFVHPFDDPDVVAGQGTLGLELLEDVARPRRGGGAVGGGGLASGVAIAIKSRRPEVEVVGVQAEACAPFPASLRARRAGDATPALTIADGIAVKQPGRADAARCSTQLASTTSSSCARTRSPRRWSLLLERAKLVVEGAGAVGVAALLGGQVAPAGERHRRSRCFGRQRRPRPAGLDRPPPRDRGRPPARAADARARPPGRAGAAARRRRPSTAPTSSRSRTCARASTSTCARPRSSSCSRPAAASTPASASRPLVAAGYEARVLR